jgi:hypothetical protein
MSKPGLVVLLFLLSGRALSQDYFVFIGSDHRQPFYVRIDSQVYPSSTEGHLVLAPLKDSAYILTIGFPGQTYPEKRYGFSIRGKDQEFDLRRQDDGSWRLYDDLTKNWVTALDKEKGPVAAMVGVKKDDAFSRMMAGVVQDTAVLYNTYAMEEALNDSPVVKKGPTESAEIKRSAADSGVVKKQTADSGIVKRKAADSGVVKREEADNAVARRSAVDSISARSAGSGVVKVSEKKSSRSVQLVYADRKDTILVIIPRDTARAADSTNARPAKPSPAGAADTARKNKGDIARKISADTARKTRVDTAQKAIGSRKASVDSSRKATVDASRKAAADSSGKTLADTAGNASKAIKYINSDCHSFATDNDVDHLRVKMMEVAKDEDRLAAFRKILKTKCFYTPHLRALSEVFTTDAGKFQFFKTAWPFAADEHFGELSSLLTDTVYIDLFKAMVGPKP